MRGMSAKLPDGIARFILYIKEDNNMGGEEIIIWGAKMDGGEKV